MDRGNVFSGGAFRVTVYATLVLAIVFVLTAVAGYRYLQEEQYGQVRARAEPVIGMYRSIYSQGGDAAVAAYLGKTASRAEVLSVRDASDTRIGGGFDLSMPVAGWHVRQVPTGAEGQSEPYYLRAEQIGSHRFVIGEALAPLQRVEFIFIRTLMSIGALLALAFVALGYLTSRSVQGKLEQMGRALQRFAGGETDVRLPVAAANDQVDRIAQTMNDQLDRLSALMAETRASAVAISHDLKRPLARSLLGMEHALMQAEQGHLPQATLEDIHVELTNLNGIFDAILRIARIDADQGVFQPQQVDLVALVRDIAETYQVVAEESGQTMTLELPEAARLDVRGDARMLTQMLANLLQNAVTHGRDDTHITLRLSDTAQGPLIEVADTGPGIAKADQARVFDAFFRAEQARSTGGNGLGLTLVKSVADRHGATITLADNAPGLRVAVAFVPVIDRVTHAC
ncbi:HAMP domain-containing sensor histidine kinase [Pseudosulfitobacter sp. DSM 107133]|uniref:HAMP domain-containing sensor histidine kinase n=1 Tax=Pseudosulfitobacter sp. DSM 107133 TaxID=2883100 RepID=UPI000DF45134|nr:HAMP domain-containing sensor histidine kinase [Pseudosulfitobacter sp. DSM 107133]UOA28645.1 Phosphate regulon sensor protein PhoR [Pseudosulfitobacter sp. DSM 107133]